MSGPSPSLKAFLPLLLSAVLALSTSTPAIAAGARAGDGEREATAAATQAGATTLGAAPSLTQLVGQKLVVAMSGTTPDADLLGRIERGEVGGVILFASNITTAGALRTLTRTLARAAAAGGQPPLLIATDQEGGTVKRLAWAPPTLSPPEMGAIGSATRTAAEGKAAGYVLRCAGINGDLAPVADVPASLDSFLYRQGRTWSFDASVTATLSDAFAAGLTAGGSTPAMKHFPGLGFATRNTDSSVVTISAMKADLEPGLLPYRQAIADGIPLIMLSNATYTAYDAANAAGWSSAISVGLLRNTMGFRGVTITDSLTGTAAARGVSATSLAVRAARAGTDMILLTGSEASTKATFATLLQDAQDGTIPLDALQASYARIAALKAALRGPVADATAPTVAAPRSRLYAPSTLAATTAPVRTSWSASDPCAVSGYTLERRTGGGSWGVQALTSATATSTTQSLRVATTFRYVVKATDGAGNRSGWAYGPWIEPIVRQSASAFVTYAGRWSTVDSTGYSGGSTRFASAAGASASYTFTGSGIAWVAAVGPTRGSAKVYIDGVYRSTVSLYAPTAALRRIVFAFNWTRQGSHTIRIVAVGTAGHPRVDVDAFVRLYRP